MAAIRPRRLESFTGLTAAENEEHERFGWETLVIRIRREFEEMPGLCITIAQGARLFGLPAETCRRLFARLQEDRVLRCTSRGLWVRFDRVA
jgi:hypothetical protein